MQRISAKSTSWEIYSGLRARAPLVVRADGRGFKKVLEGRKKPYDIDFARSMAGAVESFFLNFGPTPALAFTFSDEISLVFLEAPFAGSSKLFTEKDLHNYGRRIYKRKGKKYTQLNYDPYFHPKT